MNKYRNIYIILMLLVANILAVTSITVQAAAMQDNLQSQKIIYEGKRKLLRSVSVLPAESSDKAKRIMKEKEIEEEQQELLASIIFCEAGNQSYEGQVAVGAVVMNRMKSELFPDTMEEVIYQSGQFVPAMTGWLDKIRQSQGYTDRAMEAAKDALKGENPIGECLFFDQGGYGYQIGAHYFH